MRFTDCTWWCSKGHRNTSVDRVCGLCGQPRFERHAQVHVSERAVVYYNPATGEHRTPARADVSMPQVYEKQGFERREIMSMVGWERESGLAHEPTNFNSGNEPICTDPPAPKVSPEVKRELIRDMADAIASGPWTGIENLV